MNVSPKARDSFSIKFDYFFNHFFENNIVISFPTKIVREQTTRKLH